MPIFRKTSYRNVGALYVVRLVFGGLYRIAESMLYGAFRRGLPTALTWDNDPTARTMHVHSKARGPRS